MNTGLLIQYALMGLIVVLACGKIWRSLSRSKQQGGCSSGCGSCSGCHPGMKSHD